MVTATFDALGYARKLENAGFTREQAEVQAEALRQQLELQEIGINNIRKDFDAAKEKDLATKADLRELELRLQKEIKDSEIRLLKWQIGGWVALAAIMAKGFGWLGF